MRAGVVVPAHNEEATLGLTLEALLSQDWPGLRILVVNDGSTDGTEALVARHPRVEQLVHHPNRGLARSIDAGLRRLGDSVDVGIVLHADCVPQGSSWVLRMLAPFADPSVGAVVSSRRLAARPAGAERFFDAVAPQDFPNPTGLDREIGFVRDKCDAYRMSMLEKTGGFDVESFRVAGEDTDLSIRMRKMGFRILQSGSAEVRIGFSSHQRGLKSVFKKALQYGGAQAVLYRLHGYDGLRARAFCSAFLSASALLLSASGAGPVAWIPLVPALWMLATTEAACPVLGPLPLVLAAVSAAALLQGLGWDAPPAWACAALAVPAALAGRQALRAFARMKGHGEGLAAALRGGGLAALWWMLTGWGYGVARCRPAAR